MTIAKEGFPFIGGGALLTIFSFGLIHWGLGLVFLAPTLFALFFFRNPARVIPQEPGLIVSPADGKILAVAEVDETRYLQERRRKISIFMSPLNVHVNRSPLAGRVRDLHYSPGKYLMAFHEKSSLENEQNAIIVDGEKSASVLFIQIAGFIARRIVCYLKKGDPVERGALCGLIRFGSRVDVYLPLSIAVTVKVGDRVRGGETILGRVP
ncbi:MAG: phosphatidylserine decarboxylase family protein [Deltaproteobacteria bacterium]|nr:phosphatidylserine decarboxylase family protein [Deltaproteobacteria bacterium]